MYLINSISFRYTSYILFLKIKHYNNSSIKYNNYLRFILKSQ